MNKVRKILPALAVLILAIVGFKLLLASKAKPPEQKIEERTWTVATQTLEPQNLAPQVSLYARVESPRNSSLSAAIAADVSEVLVLEGERVTQGQVLLQLDARDVKLLLAQRQADVADIQAQILSENNTHNSNLQSLPKEKALLELAERAAERARRLQKQRVGSESALDTSLQSVEQQRLVLTARQLQISNHPARLKQLQARLQRAQALLAQSQLELERSAIKAPFNALISEVNVAVGERVRVGDALLSLYDPEALELRAQVPSRYQAQLLNALQSGQQLQAAADLQGQKLTFTLHRLAGKIDNNSGGLEALFRSPQAASLRIGQFTNLRLFLPVQDNVYALPHEALYGTDRVYLLQNERMHSAQIERVGDYQMPQGQVYLLARSKDFQPDSQLIITQLPNAMDGLKVSLPTAQPAAAAVEKNDADNASKPSDS